MQPNCKGSNVAYNKFMDIIRVMIAVAFKHIYCAFINLVFIKARYIIAHITFVQNLYYHLIFRSDFHDCLFIFVPLTPHCQSTYSSPLKPDTRTNAKNFRLLLYDIVAKREPNAGAYSNDCATKPHLIFFIISQILKIYNAKFRLRRAYLSLISTFSPVTMTG